MNDGLGEPVTPTIDEFIKQYGTRGLTLVVERVIEKPSAEIVRQLGAMMGNLEMALVDHLSKQRDQGRVV